MAFNIKLTARFQKEVKKLLKKYPSIKNELVELRNLLTQNPQLGTPIGLDCYKIRISISSKMKVKVAVQESLRIFTSRKQPFIYLQFTINQKKKI